MRDGEVGMQRREGRTRGDNENEENVGDEVHSRMKGLGAGVGDSRRATRGRIDEDEDVGNSDDGEQMDLEEHSGDVDDKDRMQVLGSTWGAGHLAPWADGIDP